MDKKITVKLLPKRQKSIKIENENCCVFCKNPHSLDDIRSESYFDRLLKLYFIADDKKRENSVKNWSIDKKLCAICMYSVQTCLELQTLQNVVHTKSQHNIEQQAHTSSSPSPAPNAGSDFCCICYQQEETELVNNAESKQNLSRYMQYASRKINITEKVLVCFKCYNSLYLWNRLKDFIEKNLFTDYIRRGKKRLADDEIALLLTATEIAKEKGIVQPQAILNDDKFSKCTCKLVLNPEKRRKISFPIVKVDKKQLPDKLRNDEYVQFMEGKKSMCTEVNVQVENETENKGSEICIDVSDQEPSNNPYSEDKTENTDIIEKETAPEDVTNDTSREEASENEVVESNPQENNEIDNYSGTYTERKSEDEQAKNKEKTEPELSTQTIDSENVSHSSSDECEKVSATVYDLKNIKKIIGIEHNVNSNDGDLCNETTVTVDCNEEKTQQVSDETNNVTVADKTDEIKEQTDDDQPEDQTADHSEENLNIDVVEETDLLQFFSTQIEISIPASSQEEEEISQSDITEDIEKIQIKITDSDDKENDDYQNGDVADFTENNIIQPNVASVESEMEHLFSGNEEFKQNNLKDPMNGQIQVV